MGFLCIWVDEGTRVGWMFRLFIRVVRLIYLIRYSDNLMRQIFSIYSAIHMSPLWGFKSVYRHVAPLERNPDFCYLGYEGYTSCRPSGALSICVSRFAINMSPRWGEYTNVPSCLRMMFHLSPQSRGLETKHNGLGDPTPTHPISRYPVSAHLR